MIIRATATTDNPADPRPVRWHLGDQGQGRERKQSISPLGRADALRHRLQQESAQPRAAPPTASTALGTQPSASTAAPGTAGQPVSR